MKRMFICAALAALMLTGCNATFQARPTDANGLFPTSSLIDADGIKIQKPFSPQYKSLVYVKTDDSKTVEYNDFFIQSIKNLGVFDRVIGKSDIESIVIQKNLSDKVGNVSDLVGLNRLAKEIGPFLIVTPYVEWKGGYNFLGQITAIDAETGETVLKLQNTAFNWAGLDKPLFYPLLNGFAQWARGEKIVTAAPKASAQTPAGH